MGPNQPTYDPYQYYQAASPDLKLLIRRYLSEWKWFVLSVFITTSSAIAYVLSTPSVYNIQASLLIKGDKKGINDEMTLKEQSIVSTEKVVENEIEVLRSTMMMTKVVDSLDLNIRYFQSPYLIGQKELYKDSPIRLLIAKPEPSLYRTKLHLTFPGDKTVQINERNFPIDQPIATPFGQLQVVTQRPVGPETEPIDVQVQSPEETVNDYLKKLIIETSRKASSVLWLSLEEEVPQRGKDILGQLIEEYNQAAISDKNRAAANTLRFVEERLRTIAEELAGAEKNVEAYKAQQGITDLSTQAQAFLQMVKENDAQLNQVKIQQLTLTTMEQYIQQKASSRGATPNTLGVNDPMLLNLITKLNELELERDKKARTVSESNPMILALDTQIRAVKGSIQDNIQTLRQNLAATARQLSATNYQLERQIRTVPYKDRALLSITRQQTIKNNLYTYLLQKREETALAYAATVSDSRVIDLAHSSVEPVKPKKRVIVLVASLFGLILPIGLIALRDMMNDRVNRRSDIERGTRIPILGEIVKNTKAKAVVLLPDSSSLISEQIRMLRTGIQFLNDGNRSSQVVLLTSSISGEGKSFMTANLGASLAMAGHATVVLAMDLRKPRVHKILSVENEDGITEYLRDEVTIDQILRPVSSFEDYWIITSGEMPLNPSELLGSPRLGQLIRELRKRFAYVLIDSSPISYVTDAQLIAPYADTTLFIVRYDVTPKTYLKTLNDLHREQRFQGLNVVLNGADARKSYYYTYGKK